MICDYTAEVNNCKHKITEMEKEYLEKLEVRAYIMI